MISEVFAKTQLLRLSGLEFFPPQKESVTELRLALQVAKTEEIAKRVVTDWIGEYRECPKPADLRRLLYTANCQVEQELRDCAGCDGTGWMMNWYAFDDGTAPERRGKPMRLFSERDGDYQRARKTADEAGFENFTVSTQAVPCACKSRSLAGAPK